MSRKAKLEGNIHDVATRPQPTDPRSATAQQAARRHPIAPSHCASPWSTARRGKYLPAPQSGPASAASAAFRTWRRSQPGPSHTRVSNNRGPADNRSAKGNKTGGKTAFFVVLGLVAIVYIVGVVAFSQIAYPTPPSPASISRFPTPHPPLPRSTQRGSTTSSPFRVKTLAGPISRIRRAHRRRRGSCPRDYRQQRAAAVAFAPDCLARRQER